MGQQAIDCLAGLGDNLAYGAGRRRRDLVVILAMDTVFSGLSLIIVIGAAMALLMRTINQPLIIGHILTGIIVGPAVFHVAKSPGTLALFSDLGIALLLFIIGLGLNPQIVKEVSKTATYVGLIQVTFITILGWILGSALGLSSTAA